jgi:hypothetical protein
MPMQFKLLKVCVKWLAERVFYRSQTSLVASRVDFRVLRGGPRVKFLSCLFA